jgi:hypothetical protein
MRSRSPWCRAAVLAVLLLCGAAWGRSFVGVTTLPSFRFGNDLGRFDWYFDVHWNSWVYSRDLNDTIHVSDKDLTFSPSAGCNFAVYDSTLTAYVGGMLGTDLRFEDGTLTDEIAVNVGLGGGLEVRLRDKVSLLAEYMLGFWISFYPDIAGLTNRVSYGFHNRPSIQVRYYIGPPSTD